jgi:hypothetical protein
MLFGEANIFPGLDNAQQKFPRYLAQQIFFLGLITLFVEADIFSVLHNAQP